VVQYHACVFLWSQGDSSLWIHCIGKNSESTVITECWQGYRNLFRGKYPWPDKWILHHDNAHAHNALRFHKFLAKKSITKTDHPLYSPYLAPCNFWLFPKPKNVLRDKDLLTFLTSNATRFYCEVLRTTIYKTVSSSGTIISRSAQLCRESISKATATACTRKGKFCFHRAIPGIKLSH
jgi:hypothetical protein